MRYHLSILWVVAAVVSAAMLGPSIASAHPLPGRDQLKFEQAPMIATTVPNNNGTVSTYFGHDELSTAYGFVNTAGVIPFYQGRYMADDFADKVSTPVVHLKWWGSYRNDVINPQMPVNKFLIAFETDVPAGQAPNPTFSRPGTPLLVQEVKRGPLSVGSGTFTETLIRGPDPILNESLYEYNAELNLGKEFKELKDTVYWLKIAALVDVPQNFPTFPAVNPPNFVTQWGWHNRDYTVNNALASTAPQVMPGENAQGPINGVPVWHFQDDSVQGNMRYDPFAVFPNNLIQPINSMSPQRYLDGIDGPAAGPIAGTIGISAFSKDLAFALYTIVPEPTTSMLMLAGLAGVFTVRRRTRGK